MPKPLAKTVNGPKGSTMVSLRMPVDMVAAIKRVAAKKELPYQTLMKQWLREKLKTGG